MNPPVGLGLHAQPLPHNRQGLTEVPSDDDGYIGLHVQAPGALMTMPLIFKL